MLGIKEIHQGILSALMLSFNSEWAIIAIIT